MMLHVIKITYISTELSICYVQNKNITLKYTKNLKRDGYYDYKLYKIIQRTYRNI